MVIHRLTLAQWPDGRFRRGGLEFATGQPVFVEGLNVRLEEELKNPGTGLGCTEVELEEVPGDATILQWEPDADDKSGVRGEWVPWVAPFVEEEEDEEDDANADEAGRDDSIGDAIVLEEGWQDKPMNDLREIAAQVGVEAPFGVTKEQLVENIAQATDGEE